MHKLLFTMPVVSSSKSHAANSSSTKSPNPKTNLCHHSPSVTLDLLILILVLFSGTFLLTSYFSYIFNFLSLILSHPTIHLDIDLPIIPYAVGFLAFFAASIASVEYFCGVRSRKCSRSGCKGLKKAMEFDLQLQTEDSLKSGSKDIDKLPWKGGSETNPDYECLRAELRKMAPLNGRAVLLFRARCGCAVAKLEGWGAKKGRRHKKSLTGGGGSLKGEKR